MIAQRQDRAAEAKRRPHVTSSSSGFGSGTGTTSSAKERKLLDSELAGVLYNRVPRKYGEMPEVMGKYQRLAPGSASYDRVIKVKGAHLRPRGKRK